MRDYKVTSRRLVLLGYNATLTTAVEAPRQPKRHFDQIQVGPLCCKSSRGDAAMLTTAVMRCSSQSAILVRSKWGHCAAQAAQKWFALP